MILLLLVLLLPLLHGGAAGDLSSDAAALFAFRSGLLTADVKWNLSTSPCSWQGVACSGGRVTSLRLPGRGLIGQIAAGTIGNLTALQTLSLRLNALSGPLPADIAGSQNLKNLYLQGNNFSGEIPSTLFGLSSLVHVDLSSNSLSGGLSAGFANLTLLRSLLLQQNRLSGEIPNLTLPQLVRFNISFNEFVGSVPPSLESMPASAFLGMPLCGGPLLPCSSPTPVLPAPPSPNPPGGSEKKKRSGLSGGAIAGIAVGSAALFLILVLLIIFLSRKKSRVSRSPSPGKFVDSRETPSQQPPSVAAAVASGVVKRLVFVGGRTASFDLEDLLRASAEVLGKGTYGTVYKAMLDMGKIVVVKRLANAVIGHKEFREKAEEIGSMDHQSLVHLLAFYYSKEEKLLVYDFMPSGSLSSLLHGGKEFLTWANRVSAALSAARGLEYIHMTGSGETAHGNIKSSNILLDSAFNARVSDQCLPLLAAPSINNFSGSGYLAPEIMADPRKFSQKADVYSFGVFLLELLSGKSPVPTAGADDGIDLPRLIRSVSPGEWRSELFDGRLLRGPEVEAGMEKMAELALDCTAVLPEKRPTMSKVAERIAAISQMLSRRGDNRKSTGSVSRSTAELSFRRTGSSGDSIVPVSDET